MSAVILVRFESFLFEIVTILQSSQNPAGGFMVEYILASGKVQTAQMWQMDG